MKKVLSIMLALFMVVTMLPLSVLPASAAAVADLTVTIDTGASVTLKDADGDGYYDVGTANDLYAFAAVVNGGNNEINGELTADITVNKNVLTANGALNGNGSSFRVWTPIGINSYTYNGTFDGGEHTVSGLYFNNSTVNTVGMFGNVYNGGKVMNVGVIDSYFCGSGYVGGLAASINDGTVENSYNTGTVTGRTDVGGLVGDLDGTITNSYNAGTVTGTSSNVGGLVGSNGYYYGTITNCYNTGSVSSTGSYVGGVVGNNYNTVKNSYNTGSVSGSAHVGGVVGSNSFNAKNVENCYNIGTVSGTDNFVGAVAGGNFSTVTNCYYLNGCATGANNVKQFGIGNGNAGSTTADVAGTTAGKNSSDFGNGSVCELVGYHSIDENCVCTICGAVEHNNFDIKGFCTDCEAYQPATLNADGYYEIGNAGQLFWFANYINTVDRTANAVLTADIDLEGRPWTPIGSTGESSNNFRGIFDGQNHTIEGLYVEGGRAGLGFFGEVRTGTVKNFTIYGEVVANTEVDYIGGVIGSVCGVNGENDLARNGAVVQNITSYVNLTAKKHGIGKIGGFVGYANHESLIENCSWYGTFDAGIYRVDSGAGGFIGKIQENTSEVTIRNCGAYGTIKTNYAGDYNNTATIYMGGFLSFTNTNAKTTLENCLFAGKFERGANLTDEAFLGAFGTVRSVNAIKNCYYLGDDGLEAVHSDSNLKPGSDNVEIIKVTAEQLKSGEVAYKLQGTQSDHFWGQTIGTDNYPILGGEKVYHGYTSCADKVMVYSNDSSVSATNPAHVWGEGVLTRPTKTEEGYYTYTCSACGETKTEPVERAANYADYTKALEDLRAYLDSDMLTDENKSNISAWLAMYDSDEAYSFIAGEEATVQEYIDATAYYASEFEAAIADCLAGNHSGSGFYCEICGASLHTCDFTGEWKYDADKHWKECTDENCDKRSEEAAHNWSNKDGICADGCGAICTHENQSGTTCQICGVKKAADLSAIIDTGEQITLKDSDGDGYYDISTADELYAFASAAQGFDIGIKGKLKNDITVNENVLTDDGELNGDGSGFRVWTPIGYNSSMAYEGTFDGNGHTISGLYFNDDTNTHPVGLILYVSQFGLITNVSIIDSYLSANKSVGGLAGRNEGTIENCCFNGVVIGADVNVGGVVGYNDGGQVLNCQHAGFVSGYKKVGGVVGYNSYGTLTDCHNTGSVNGFAYVGGVAGESLGGKPFDNCYNTGAVTGEDYYVGGVVGYSGSYKLQNCYNTGAVTSMGSNSEVGGVVGYCKSSLINCYNTGSVSDTGVTDGGIAGFVINGYNVNNCYYLDTCNDDDDYGTPKTEAQFTSGEVAYLLQSGVAAVDGTVPQIWGQNIGSENTPVLGGDKVYGGYITCKDDVGMVYSNNAADVTETKPDHIEEIVPGKAATCTEAGLTEGVKCSVCDGVLTAQKEIPVVAHTPDEDSYFNMDCDSHRFICSACDTEVIESHVFHDGTCVCGVNAFTGAYVSNIADGWYDEDNYEVGTYDQSFIYWAQGDEINITFESETYGTQSGTIAYDGSNWIGDIAFVYDEGDNFAVTAIYGKGNGTEEHFVTKLFNVENNTIAISFQGDVRTYSRLRIAGTADITYTVSVTDFIPNGTNESGTYTYFLTADEKGNAYLYGTFAEGSTVIVKQGEEIVTDYTFGIKGTVHGKSLAICAVNHTKAENATQTCKGYKCTACGGWFGEANENAHDSSNQDGICAICGKTLHTCDFSGEWKTDADKHWKECSCGLISEEGTHTGGTATCTTQAVCETCNTSYGEVAADAHDWSNKDGICANGCGAECPHENQTGAVCEVCGKTLHVCDFSGEWKYDADKHWKECTADDCDKISEEADHDFLNGECTVCDYVCDHANATSDLIRPVQNADGTWGQGSIVTTCPDCGNVETESVDRADYTAFDAAVAKLQAILAREDLIDGPKATVTTNLNSVINGVGYNKAAVEQTSVNDGTQRINGYIAMLEAGLADGTMKKADLSHMTALLDEINALIDSNPNNIVSSESGNYYGPYYYHKTQINNGNLSQADYDSNMVTYKYEALLETLLDDLKDGTALRADYTEIDEVIAAIDEALKTASVTEDMQAELDSIKKELDAYKASSNVSVAMLANSGLLAKAEAIAETMNNCANGVHVFTKYEVVVEPACEVAGKEVAVCDNGCGATDEKAVEALGHTELPAVKENEIAATCENAGSYDLVVYCDVCKAEVSRTTETVDALGHTELPAVKENEIAATCENAGSYDLVVYCDVCNAEVSRTTETVDARGHAFTVYTVTAEPTCEEAGKQVSVCDNGCGATDEQSIAALGHTEETVKGYAATCTATGLTDGVKCSVCDEILTAQQTIAQTAHKDDNGDYKCDYGCGHEFEKPAEPDQPDEPEDPSADCDHLCHKGGFLGFFWKLIRFFYRLFNIKQTCECGALHFDEPLFG